MNTHSRKQTLIKRLVFTLAILFSASGYTQTGMAPNPEDVKAGKVLYQKYCQSCHQKDGKGERPIPKHIRMPGYLTAMPLDESSHAWHHTDEQLISTILNGLKRTQRMPAWKSVMTEAEAGQIVAYIKSFWSDRILSCQGPKHMSCM